MGTGIDLFGKMGVVLLGLGFGQWEWEIMSSKMGMGLR
jgi:hypothetical protein